MQDENRITKKLSRCSFLHGLGVTAVAGALAACQPKDDADQSYDDSCDFAQNQRVITDEKENGLWNADDIATWNVALTDAEVAALAAGCSPLFIRPQHLTIHRFSGSNVHICSAEREGDLVKETVVEVKLRPSCPGMYVDAENKRVWYVDSKNGSDDNSGESIDKALATYKAAIARSSSEDTVLVWDGCPDWIIL